MSNDDAIFYTVSFGVVFAAFAFLRALATERQHRIDAIRDSIVAEREAAREQQHGG